MGATTTKPTTSRGVEAMIGTAALVAMGISYLVVKKLDKMSEYKEPKGKNKNRYR